MKRSVNAVRVHCQEKKQTFSVELPDEKVPIAGDPEAIGQMVDNLIDNAVKYTPENGAISAKLTVQQGSVELEVSDTGIGISPQHQQRIFERFYRVDKARSRDLGGTGLGLSIVKNIAEQHGGSVKLESRLGAGSTFRVTLPLTR